MMSAPSPLAAPQRKPKEDAEATTNAVTSNRRNLTVSSNPATSTAGQESHAIVVGSLRKNSFSEEDEEDDDNHNNNGFYEPSYNPNIEEPSSSSSTHAATAAAATTSTTTTATTMKIQELIDLESPWQLAPKPPSKCPIFCCFYAEFDIKKGPVVRYQCPKSFMDQDINQITTSDMHAILAKTFDELGGSSGKREKEDEVVVVEEETEENNVRNSTVPKNDGVDNNTYNNNNNTKEEEGTKEEEEEDKEPSTAPASAVCPKDCNDSGDIPEDGEQKVTAAATVTTISVDRQSHPQAEEKTTIDDIGTMNKNNLETSSDSSVKLSEGAQSIFDATSEYIITGSELTGKIITLSTHDMHVMTRPTQIADERYERNALLFSIGFVLRRAADPRPFRPLISKLAMALRSMEVESGVLSNPSKADRIQTILERVLIAMNSPRWECNFLLDRYTALNLKLFHPPKPQTSPVHEYQVPILLRIDLQLQMYEWDLAINWVILHIDGIMNARQISIKAEVDLEMVLACLRVLKHHGVISVVDMFMYTNRYEFTEKAAAMLAGKEDKLLQEAVNFAMKRPAIQLPTAQNLAAVAAVAGNSTGMPIGSILSGGSDNGATGSPKTGSLFFPAGSLVAPGTPSSSYPPRTLNLLAAGGSHRSSNFRYAMMAANSLEREAACLGGRQQEERRHLKTAFGELYCACNRNLSFGDLWLSLTTEQPPAVLTSSSVNNKSLHRGSTLSSNYPRSVSNRKDSITDADTSENEGVAFSPLEASLLDSMRNSRPNPVAADDKNGNNNNGKCSSSPTWKEIFRDFDHRRFISFGVVHGLLTRVHYYPFFPGPFPGKRGDSCSNASVIAPFESSSRQPINFKHELAEDRQFQLAKSVAAAMDGTACDDELVCKFEEPINKLVDLVEKYSGKRVIYIYSSSSL